MSSLTWDSDEVVLVLHAADHAGQMDYETWDNPLDEANAQVITSRWHDLVEAFEQEQGSVMAKAALLDHAQVVLAFAW